MNTFTLQLVKRMPKVTYYTVVINGGPLAEFDDFAQRCIDIEGAEENLDIQEVMGIVKAMGYDTGAILAGHNYFRNEAVKLSETKAIPGDEDGEFIGNLLRLYCKVISEGIVILYNGDWKTPSVRRAQDCKFVARHFHNANGLSLAIDRAIDEIEIGVNEMKRELDVEEGAVFQFEPTR